MTNTESRRVIGRLRVGPWRGNRQIALIAPVPEGPLPDERAVRECCDRLAARGIERALTGALTVDERDAFVAAGFVEHERLHLLIHDLRHVPTVESPARLRRARRTDRPAVLDIDHRAFDDFWQLDEAGLLDAIAATPVARFRAGLLDTTVVGYAVCGRAGPRGFVQRLAVHPSHRGIGLGAALVVDGLHWLQRHGADQALVNTQVGNNHALELYQRLGFRLQPTGLVVLTRALTSGEPAP